MKLNGVSVENAVSIYTLKKTMDGQSQQMEAITDSLKKINPPGKNMNPPNLGQNIDVKV